MFRTALLLLGCFALSACGLKGPLHLPETDRPTAVEPPGNGATPPGAAAPSSTASDDDKVDTKRPAATPQ